MTEYIGSRISLLSKSDIRYVGTLHEISSETATVALENVRSYGTEGRLENPEDEVAPSDNVYEYIQFRGSDVKDLRIEEAPAAKENKPPQVPNDPAILGSGTRPTPTATQATPKAQNQQATRNAPGPQGQAAPSGQQGPPGFQPPPHFQQGRGQPPQFPGQPPFPYYYPPPPPGRGFPHGGPPGPGFPGMPYGIPPGWYPPNGQGFPQGFSPSQMPQVPHGQAQHLPPGAKPPQQGPNTSTQQQAGQVSTGSKPSSKNATPAPAGKAPPPPLESKPSVASALAPPKPITKPDNHAEHSELAAEPVRSSKTAPKGPKSSRIVPAVPIASPKAQTSIKANGYAAVLAKKAPAEQQTQTAANAAIDSATQAATAAVAAAMAKLPPAPGQQKQASNAMDNLTQRVNDMRTNDRARHPRGDGTHRGGRGARGAHRGGERGPSRKVEVPKDDYDFETANARFNKQDLVKEAIASGSPIENSSQVQNDTSASNASQDGDSVNIPPSYNKSSSFFDDISSEIKDREEKRPGGREWRGEEQKKNLETFGQGSVDNGYRGGFRGRGRGRGFGRGRGGFGGRGGHRGQRGDSHSPAVPSAS